jgi:futalosine hydrolase
MVNGIITSTLFEAGLILKQLSDVREFSIQGKQFYSGALNGIRTTLAICGAGKANSAHATALLIERFAPELVCNIGIAGAYPSSGLKVGDIAIANMEIYGDEGLELKSGFISLNELFGKDKNMNEFKFHNSFAMHIPENLKDIRAGHFVTVSTCSGTLDKGVKIENRFNAICENMEGAAVAHICSFSGIPAVEMRGISNIIEDRIAEPINKSDIIKAAENVQRFFLERFV